MFDNPPSLVPEQEEAAPSLVAPQSLPAMSDNVITQRAARADFALGEASPGAGPLKDAFVTGQEKNVRLSAAGTANAEFQQAKLDKIKEVSQSGVPVDDKTVNGLMALGTTPEANPETVIEDKFARNYVNFATIGENPDKNAVFQSAFSFKPEETMQAVQQGTAMTSRALQARNALEEAEAAYSQIPWFNLSDDGKAQMDKSGDLIKNVVSLGFREYALQRNLLQSSPAGSYLPGSNKLEQIQYLYLLPHDQFLPALKAAAGPDSQLWKDSPGTALDFIRAATSFGTSDAYVDNAMGIVNTVSILPVGAGLKAIGRLRGGREVSSAMQTAEQAARDILSTSSKLPATAADRGAKVAEDVLGQSSKPLTQGYYIPKAASTDLKGETSLGPVTVDKNGTPVYQTGDGAYVDLHRAPEEGSIPLKVEPGKVTPTYYNKEGNTPYTQAEGRTTVGDRRTIFVDKKSYENLSQVLDENKNLTLLEQADGKWHVGDLDHKTPGKRVPNSIVKVSNEPREGLYPIHIPEGTDKIAFDDFGSRITRVDQNSPYKVTFGPRIAAREEIEAKTAIGDIVKSVAETHPQDALSKMGQHEAAAKTAAVTDISNDFNKIVENNGDVEAIRRNLPSLVSPQTFFHNASSLSRELKDRLITEAQSAVNDLTAAIANPTRVERLTPEGIEAAVNHAKDNIVRKYNRASNSILDQVVHHDLATNTRALETKFGKRDGTLFDSSIQATHFKDFQYRLGKSATVEQEGNKFYLSHIQHIEETYRAARDGLVVAENTTPSGWWTTMANAVLGKAFGGGQLGLSARSSAYTLSPFQREARITTTHAPSTMRKAIEDTAEGMGSMPKAERQEMIRILEHNRDYVPPGGSPDLDRGMFYKSALEFETAFHGMHGHLPTPQQVKAYDQFVRLSDLDWTLNAMNIYRDKARLGLRDYKVDIHTTDELGIPSKAKTEWFNGKQVENFDPVNTQDANIYVAPEGRFTHKFDKTVDDVAMMKKIKDGTYQVIQVAAPREKPLFGLTGVRDDIHFVVVDKFEDKALRWGADLDYRPGGHVMYQDPWFLKVPQIGIGTKGRVTHFGDATIKSFATEREGLEWAKKYNTARELLHAKDEAGLQAYFDAGHLPETSNEFKKWYTGGGFDINTEHPFILTPSGRDTFQASEELSKTYEGLKNQFSSYDLTQTYSSKFTADRDRPLSTIANQGTEENPHFVNVNSRLYDPYTALNKAMGDIVRQRWMGDYKNTAAESWVQEFWHLFDQSKLPRAKLEQNPTYWLYHAQGNIDLGLAQKNPELISAAMVSRQHIINFLGARDEVGSVLKGLEQKAITWIEDKTSAKTAGWTQEKALPAITSAPEYARRVTFDAVLGTYNPVQLFQQANGLTHVLALSPLNGMKGTTASALARLYRYTENPAIIDSMANKAAAMGWDKDHFIEAWGAWKASGTHTVAGETGMLSTLDDPKLFRTSVLGRVDGFLDKGRMFFKAGEEFVRDTSFFTAYADWRKANPTGVLDNIEMQTLMRRFDTLSMNMTRASNAAYNEGLLSVPTQFFTWNARFTEQMLDGTFSRAGGQLTWGEKARVFGLYSAMYGIPATLGGITFGVIPGANYADIRQYAMDKGYNLSDKFYQSISEGIPAMLTNMISGHNTDFQRFSPNASQVNDILSGKKTVHEAVVGASGNWWGNLGESLYPFAKFAWSTALNQDDKYQVTKNDLLNLAENISTFSNLEKMVVALHTGKLFTRREGLVQSDLDTFDSVMLSLGLSPKKASDAYLKMDYKKELASVQKKFEPMYLESLKLGIQAMSRGDTPTMVTHMSNAKTIGVAAKWSLQQQSDLYQKAMSGSTTSLVDQAERMWQDPNVREQLRSIPAMKQYFENMKK